MPTPRDWRRRPDIPWADLPGSHYAPAPPPTPPLTTSAPACAADQLTVAQVEHPGDTDDNGAIIDLRNVSGSSCLLAGPVLATLYGPGAPEVVLRGTGVPDGWASHDMAPGGVTSVWFTSSGACLSRPATGLDAIPVTRVRLAVPGGGSVLVTGLHLPRACDGPRVGGFWQHPVDPAYPPMPLAGARIDVEAPRTVRAESTLDYVVAVTNPTDAAITMTPCPSFAEFMSPFPDKLLHGLNCDGHPALLPHETLRFQMRLTLPAGETDRPEKLFWALDNAVGGSPPTIVTVIGSSVPTPSVPRPPASSEH